jgi:hypothetical protein
MRGEVRDLRTLRRDIVEHRAAGTEPAQDAVRSTEIEERGEALQQQQRVATDAASFHHRDPGHPHVERR